MRCLVTGASGFLGSWLIRKLIESEDEVLASVRDASDLWRIRDLVRQVALVKTSLADVDSTAKSIREFRPDTAFHLSWTGGNSSQYANQPSQILDNVPGTLRLVRICHEAGCGAFVFVGSCLEYGTYRIPVKETDIMEPRTLYGASKQATALLVQALCSRLGMRFCGVRLFWSYGPMDEPARMIPSVIKNLFAGVRPALTPGDQLWDYLFVEDTIRGLLALGKTSSASGMFNLGSGDPHSVKEVACFLRDLVNPKLPLGFGEVAYSPDQVMHLQADISRISDVTGWKPIVHLHEGLRRTVDHYRAERGITGRRSTSEAEG